MQLEDFAAYRKVLEYKNEKEKEGKEEKEDRKDAGGYMEFLRKAYCNNCGDEVWYVICQEMVEEQYKGEKIQYKFAVGRCKNCNSEVATDIDYSSRKSKAKIEAYKKKINLIDINEISEILNKYDVGKEALADIAGFGKVTIKRYYDGFIPSREYSDILRRMLDEEEYFMELVEKNKDKLKDVAYRKIMSRQERLSEIGKSKIDQIVNYIVTKMGEVTPLALEKLLSFSNGVNYALNGTRLIEEESQAWAHGPVYPQVYNKYKRFGYKPIDNGIYSTHGCMLSKLKGPEIQAIDMVIHTFGLYSPKILEDISHTQEPWREKRLGYKEGEVGKEVIDEESVKAFYTERNLNTEKAIMDYIMTCIGDRKKAFM